MLILNMPIPAEVLIQHIEYSGWANARLLQAAQGLTEQERLRDFGTADKSVSGTLAHIFGAERLWLARLEHRIPLAPFVSDRDRKLETLATEWPALQQQWRAWAASLDDGDSARELEYADTRGRPWKNRISHIVLHVVNHSTHHRGQVSGFLRAMGRTPPPLDFIAFVRQMPASAGQF